MRIAIEYNSALRQVAGIGRYTRELVRALAELQSGDEIVLVYAARDLKENAALDGLRRLQSLNPRVTAVPIPLSERWLTILWQRARLPLPIERWTGAIDVLHAPDFVLPPARTPHRIVTVHDLSFRLHPEAAHQRLRRYLESAVPRSLRRAERVLVVSHSTAHDLERLMHVSADKIRVLYHGIGTQFRRVEDAKVLSAVRARYGLPQHFLLHVGTIEPRKNLLRLIAAYEELRKERRYRDLGLVLAGKPGWLADPILRRAGMTPGVILTGAVADDDLPALYSLADVLAYPSLYEGFGFPPLEALACGTPAVTSNTSSLPELVAGAALMVDPQDSAALAAALRRALDDPAVAEAARTAGPEHAARFTWPEAARQLLEVYRALADGSHMTRPAAPRGK
jgi:glycosyltransferase involved in cell wall biosynthesis